jgi:type IV fimbrial biogenesis protein FimT
MLNRTDGFTLIELMVTIALLGILSSLAAPSFTQWIQNQHIRTAAEGIYNGLQLAEAEAAKRNQVVDFALVSSTPTAGTAPVPTSAGPNWVVAVDQGGAPAASGFIMGGLGSDGGPSATVAATSSVVSFSGVGVSSGVTVSVTNPAGGSCASAGGKMQCLTVTATKFGQVRMCNPTQPAGSPQAC